MNKKENLHLETEIKIQLSNTERVILKRIDDNTILASVEEDLSGITRKLAFFDLKNKQWIGYNSHNFSLWFTLCKEHKVIKPKVIRFITTSEVPEDVRQMKRTFTCFKRRINITVNKIAIKTKHDLEEIRDMVMEPFN